MVFIGNLLYDYFEKATMGKTKKEIRDCIAAILTCVANVEYVFECNGSLGSLRKAAHELLRTLD